jgi:hypothetical protein
MRCTHYTGTFDHRLVRQVVNNVDLEAVSLKAAISDTGRSDHRTIVTFLPLMSGPGKVPPARTALLSLSHIIYGYRGRDFTYGRTNPSGEITLFATLSVPEGPSAA